MNHFYVLYLPKWRIQQLLTELQIRQKYNMFRMKGAFENEMFADELIDRVLWMLCEYSWGK